MAAHERLGPRSSIASTTLLQKLAKTLPKDASFKVYHLSTPPTQTTAIYPAPPDARPDRTYCENHFLAISIAGPRSASKEEQEVLVYAVEVLIYSTAYDTTLFVSKADSTGYLHLLNLPKGTPSPVRDISAIFLQHLVEGHQRPFIRSVVSLFARAQDQYLFPGSVENSGKHVLDDRGLVKWWCRVLDPLIDKESQGSWKNVKGHLVIPGLDSHETSSFVPRKSGSTGTWTMGHPLLEISRHVDVPPRCFVPRFPDDPKARYLEELDGEISRGKDNATGQWKSVKSIAQFWEMMAFRQECSAGRMVGFIWVVFTPAQEHPKVIETIKHASQTWDMGSSQPMPSDTPATSFSSNPPQPESSFWTEDNFPPASQQSIISEAATLKSKRKTKKKLFGPITARKPRIKTENKNYLLERPESTPYYLWRPSGRGQVVVDETDYKRVTELLLRLDFANLELAASSSARWVNEVRSGASGSMRDAWGETVVGEKVVEVRMQASAVGVQSLKLGLVRKKRRPGAVVEEPEVLVDEGIKVNVLATGMVRKKPKA